MTKLSVNINKVALIRNARGEDHPDLNQFALRCEAYGAQGITVHPRPDERHIRYEDVRALKSIVSTELNVEGYPNQKYMDLVKEVKPHQCTLVPDPPDAITSNSGWDTMKNFHFLQEIVQELKQMGTRVSIFMGTDPALIEKSALLNIDRIELYTGPYASQFHNNKENAIRSYVASAKLAKELHLDLNAGHDLNLTNLAYFKNCLTHLDEVSIGHALISDALYYGLENTIQMYLRCLE